MKPLALADQDKQLYVKEVGEYLVRHHGQQNVYTPEQVKQASDKSRFGVDWACWAMTVFSSHDAFDDYHARIGETCDYAAMKSDMVSLMTDGASDAWFDIDLSWLEWPDIDLGSIFDFL